ncbi:MAG: hypothetical protein QHH43_06300 [Candidatus Saccharicenans sp.]|jgi:hypothetical protein|nr:hypothetical protein [Candidatus Saccharicenans sp.]MDH7575350.1 hypothetical protein [Candidatus Saccharicenans sp.]
MSVFENTKNTKNIKEFVIGLYDDGYRRGTPEYSVVFKLSGKISRNMGKYLQPVYGNLWQLALTNIGEAAYILEGNNLYVIDNKVNKILSNPGTLIAQYMANEKHLSRRIVGEN